MSCTHLPAHAALMLDLLPCDAPCGPAPPDWPMKHCTPEVVHLSANLGLPTHLACCPAAEPIHLPHLIGPMKHYLWILKTTHGGQDMDTCLEMAKGSLDGEPLPPDCGLCQSLAGQC